VVAGKLLQLAIYKLLASYVVVSKLYTAGELYITGELCDSGRAMWQWASYVAVGKLCGSRQAM
jgi:hypothetical protein